MLLLQPPEISMTRDHTSKNRMRVPPWTLAAAATLLFGILDVAASLTSGAAGTRFHNPLGLLALALTGGFHEAVDAQRVASIFKIFVASSAVMYLASMLLAGLACMAVSTRRRVLLIGAQVACALALDSLPLHVLAAAQMGMLLPWRRALALLATQYAAGVAVIILLLLDLAAREHHAPKWGLLAYLAAEQAIFAAGFIAARLVLRERRTRQSLATAHAQILATQSLLAQTVRGAERLRIARDLHDTIGHHLTALNLHLDLAMRQATRLTMATMENNAHEGVASSLLTARTVSGELLAQVRSVVSGTRQDQGIDLADAIHMLCKGIPGLAIAVRIEPDAARHPAQVAHTLFCCIQEAVTNALRHAHARQLTIELRTSAGMTIARVTDDGHGNHSLVEGNGLRGMRERLSELDGELRYARQAGGGLALEMRVPQWVTT